MILTVLKPGQITIDINGQMDSVNTGNGYKGPPIHAISIFANPYMKKPVDDGTIQFVEPGVKPSPKIGNKKTLYFKPGVHNIGRDFRIFANKNYYIPGDAIVYGTLSNESINNDNPGSSGQNIRIYGYGTLSGDSIKHGNYDADYTASTSPYYKNDKTWKLISCLSGKLYLVVLDIRPKQPNFGKWESFIIGPETSTQVLIPPGFANGHYVLEDNSIFHYKLAYEGEYNDVENQGTIIWNDKRFNIDWPSDNGILAQRDK